MDSIDPSSQNIELTEITGFEPVLGGHLAEKAVWVDVLDANTVYMLLQTLS